jgi:hypothetical protein
MTATRIPTMRKLRNRKQSERMKDEGMLGKLILQFAQQTSYFRLSED